MTEEVQQRIFEPFYTTKFTGRGLGLSAVRGIVKGHRGLLRVRSKAGCGTCFTVALPAQAVEKKAEEPVNQVASIRNTGIVLFVEDEPLLQQLGQKMLKTLGLNSLVAGDGIEAVRMYKERGHEISVVMLDMTMPYMNGEETYHELRKIDPNVTVILASGYTESELHERFTNCPIAGFMHKPYNLSTMREALRKVLNRSRET